MTGIVQTHTHFLRRDAFYATEKPYSLRFTPPTGFPRSNIKLEKRDIKIRNIRGSEPKPSFAEDGCSLVDLRTKMLYGDFDDEERIKEVYLKEVADCLKTFLGAHHVQIFEHTVRFSVLSCFRVGCLAHISRHREGEEASRHFPHINWRALQVQSTHLNRPRR